MSSTTRICVSGVAAVTVVSFIGALIWRRHCARLEAQVRELQAALDISLKQRAAERKGRIRAQQTLRNLLIDKPSFDDTRSSFPMTPIGFIQSCFSTRNGTPRQPFLVPLARACLVLSPGGVPATAFDGLAEYTHCWLLYVFHANTDLPHLWNQPSHKDFKAKVRVPRLDGGKLGVYATRTPHRPCPLGLTVAKVEGVHGRMLLISGADLIDGTPVLDVKPYLPYSDAVPDARAPTWVKAGEKDDPIALASVHFSSNYIDTITKIWEAMGKFSMYSSPQELQMLIEQVLSRDIRSLRQRKNPRASATQGTSDDYDQLIQLDLSNDALDTLVTGASGRVELEQEEALLRQLGNEESIVYRLKIEGITISYTVDGGHVVVHDACVSALNCVMERECNYMTWLKVAGSRNAKGISNN